MLKNYIDETYLKGFVPELARYLWSGETTYDKQKQSAEQIVLSDFINKGYNTVIIRPDLYLRSDTDTLSASSTGDTITAYGIRMRLAYNVTVRTGTTSIVLQGSNDDETWNTIQTTSITDTGSGSFVFLNSYTYYRINSTITAGTLAFTAWLTETNYDLWFAYKWLELILMSAYTNEDDQYYKRMEWFRNAYNELWNGAVILSDDDFDGEVDTSKSNVIDRLN